MPVRESRHTVLMALLCIVIVVALHLRSTSAPPSLTLIFARPDWPSCLGALAEVSNRTAREFAWVSGCGCLPAIVSDRIELPNSTIPLMPPMDASISSRRKKSRSTRNGKVDTLSSKALLTVFQVADNAFCGKGCPPNIEACVAGSVPNETMS